MHLIQRARENIYSENCICDFLFISQGVCADLLSKKSLPKEDLNSLSKVQILELLEHFKILLNMTQGGILGILKMFTQSPRDFEVNVLNLYVLLSIMCVFIVSTRCIW